MLSHQLNETLFSLHQICVGLVSETSLTVREIIVFLIIAGFTLFAYYVFENE
jgi:hypothetical protein